MQQTRRTHPPTDDLVITDNHAHGYRNKIEFSFTEFLPMRGAKGPLAFERGNTDIPANGRRAIDYQRNGTRYFALINEHIPCAV